MIFYTISPGNARLVLRIYFIAVLASVAWLSGKVLTNRARLHIIRRDNTHVPRLFGWIQGPSLLRYLPKLRHLPGGKTGFSLMVLVYSLSHVTDLTTTSLVKSITVPSRCVFGEGLVVDTAGPWEFTYPPVNGAPYILIHNSQYTSINNSGSPGIFRKANRDPRFCPTDQDTLGTWSCTSGSLFSYAAGTPLEDVGADLQNQGLLYPTVSATFTAYNNEYAHAIIWSSSAASDDAGTIWNVSAAVQTNPSPRDPVSMLTLSCVLDAPEAEPIISKMQSLTTLEVWKFAFQGLMYYGSGTPLVQDPEQELAIVLNTMVMVQGGNNYVLASPPAGEDQTQGCLAVVTNVPRVVEALFMIVAVLFGAICLLSFFYALRIWMQDRELRRLTRSLPDDVSGWASVAVREHLITDGRVENVEQIELQDWVMGIEGAGVQRRLRIMPAQEAPAKGIPLKDVGRDRDRGSEDTQAV
ncbi:hypothetical protein MMC25_004918 [Agyrium rufum]|nr:hypothetical protein [Agyrium rufum]